MNQVEAYELNDGRTIDGLFQPDRNCSAYSHSLLVEEAGMLQHVCKAIQKNLHKSKAPNFILILYVRLELSGITAQYRQARK